MISLATIKANITPITVVTIIVGHIRTPPFHFVLFGFGFVLVFSNEHIQKEYEQRRRNYGSDYVSVALEP